MTHVLKSVTPAVTGERVGQWIQTRSGASFWPLDPRPEEIDIADIASALSKQCRYGGHCKRFYSVAEHCVFVARFAPEHLKLTALLHDASEAYLVDIPRPIKVSLNEYLKIESRLEKVIAEKYSLPYPWPPEVKLLDNRIVRDEVEQIMATPATVWAPGGPPLGIVIPCWQPHVAEEKFLAAFKEYHGG